MAMNTGNPLDSVQVPSSIENDLENPFQDCTTLAGFNAEAWIDSVKPYTPPYEPINSFMNAPTKTIYELVSSSKTTSTFARLIGDFPSIVSLLEDTTASYTLFVPTNAAVEGILEYLQKAPQERVENILKYHLSDHNLHSSFLLISPTLPQLYEAPILNGDLRMHFCPDSKGLALNYYSHIVSSDIIAKNGTIHVIDKIVLPPPLALHVIELLPGEFSTFQLGLLHTGLAEEISTDRHSGITLFAPRNTAFQKLGTAINEFLFSKAGKSYLLALLQYHVAPNKTLYSNAFYYEPRDPVRTSPSQWKDVVNTGANRPKGVRKFNLPTMLEGQAIDVVITRDGPEIEMRVNEVTTVAVKDGIAADGVVHAMDDILLPCASEGLPTLARFKELLEIFLQ